MNTQTIYWLSALFLFELSLVLTIYIIYMVKNSSNKSNVAGSKEGFSQLSGAGITDYFTEEIDRTLNEISSRDENALNNPENLEFLPLNLRLSILELEQVSASKYPDKYDIKNIETDLLDVLNRYKILTALKLAGNSQEYVEDEYKDLIDKQNKTIEFLKKYANEILVNILKNNEQLIQDTDNEEYASQLSDLNKEFKVQTEKMMSEIKNLETNNVEMNQCMGVLEEENLFLRNQIEQLLKIESS